MAMPMPSEPHDERSTPETRTEDTRSSEPVSGTRARRAPPPRPSPDEEAMLLMMRVVERAQVAKSFAKLAAGLLTVGAARASAHLTEGPLGPLKSRIDSVRKIARAATEAAVHVAAHRPEAAVEPEADAEPKANG